MFIYPESYAVKWEKVGNSHELSIDFGGESVNLQ